MSSVLRSMWQFRHLIVSMAMVSVRARYRRTALGLLWSMLGPVAIVLVIGTVYGQLVGRSFGAYVPFLFAGLFPWTFIAQVASTGCVAFINAEGYVKQIAVPLAVYPARNVVASFVHFLFSFAALVLILLAAQMLLPIPKPGPRPAPVVEFSEGQPAPMAARIAASATATTPAGAGASAAIFHPLGLITVLPGIAILFVFGLGLGVFQAVVGTVFRDYQHISGILFQALFYATPIIYPPEILGHRSYIYAYNPFHYLISAVREPLLTGSPPSLLLLGVAAAVSVALLWFSAWLLGRIDRRLVSHL